MSVFDNAELMFALYEKAHEFAHNSPKSNVDNIPPPWRLPFKMDGRKMGLMVDTDNNDRTLQDRLSEYRVRIYIEKLFNVVVTFRIGTDQYIQTEILKNKTVLYQNISDEEIEHYFMIIRLQYGE